MPSDSKEFKQLEKRIWALLTVRQIVWWSAWWFFALGLTVLLVRILTWWPTHYLVAAIAGVLPVAVALGIWRWKHRPDRVAIQALLDRENRAGGLIMASEQVETSDWKRESGELTIPQFRWRSNRGMMVFASAAVFLGIAILLPEKHLGLAARRSLEVGQLVSEIADEIKLLDEEEILEEDKANELTKELARLEKDASGNDPAKTWEALDHLKESNSELAKQAAEEALKKLDALKKSETLAGAVGIMPEPNDAAESRAMQDLAALIDEAKLGEGLLKSKLPKDLMDALKKGEGLKPEELKKLIEALQANKKSLGECMSQLASMNLIDAAMLGKCNKAGQCPNPKALAAFLSGECKGDESLKLLIESYCRGGITRGRGDAPMTWQDPSNLDGTDFKDQSLPFGTMAGLKNAQFVGISRSAPEVTGAKENVSAGALNGAKASGGSAQVQRVLPRHKGAVQRFFKRDGQ